MSHQHMYPRASRTLRLPESERGYGTRRRCANFEASQRTLSPVPSTPWLASDVVRVKAVPNRAKGAPNPSKLKRDPPNRQWAEAKRVGRTIECTSESW